MSIIYLIPSFLDDEAVETIPPYVLDAVKKCTVIFAENERTTRRFLKALDKSIVIDHFEWFPIHKAEEEQLQNFRNKIKEGKNIAIVSEAGCPGIADPGQILVNTAMQLKCTIKPLVGPSSILLALMASGMNGQQFEFQGYLPIETSAREKMIREMEAKAIRTGCTSIFIETPYRNNQLMESVITVCKPSTRFCTAVNLTGKHESIITKTVGEWKNSMPDIHKKPAIFLLGV